MDISAISSVRVDLQATLSSIQDANIVEDKMKNDSLQIQQQAALGMLKQAMDAPKQILDLLA